MPEFPIIMTHNVLDGAKITGNDIPSHELERMRDGHRHTWWQAPGTSPQTIQIRAASVLTNTDFEVSIVGWTLVTDGAGAGTFARNTSSPIEGLADGLLTATTANGTTDLVMAIHTKANFFRANRTYRIMLRALVQDAGPKNIRIGLLDQSFVEDPALVDDQVAQITDTGHFFDITPINDGWFVPFVRAIEPQTLQFDEIIVNEVRDIDTLMIDAGHTLQFALIDVDFRNTETQAWSNVLNPSVIIWNSPAPVYITFDAQMALAWRINITVFTFDPNIDVAKAPLLYLGKRWELPHHFSGSFDPDMEQRFEDMTIGDRGVAQRSLKFNQRQFRAAFTAINATHYLDVEKFFEDTDVGTKPFFFNWQPVTTPNKWLVMRLKGSRMVPFRNGALRDWNVEFEELAGKREI